MGVKHSVKGNGAPLTGHGVRAAIEAAAARPLYLPPYSPDFSPIENAFAKLKALLRKAADRSAQSLWATIGAGVSAFGPQEYANYFATARLRHRCSLIGKCAKDSPPQPAGGAAATRAAVAPDIVERPGFQRPLA